MTGFVHRRPCELVFNVDEVGCSDWEDGSEKSVIILICLKSKMIHHGIRCSRKHITALRCVAAAGELLSRYVVIISKLNRYFWKEAGLI
jgi:hypothetical protein